MKMSIYIRMTDFNIFYRVKNNYCTNNVHVVLFNVFMIMLESKRISTDIRKIKPTFSGFVIRSVEWK